ncbi:MAG: RNA methyltransferase [Bacteroidales bacterium]|nr:RNA methyltransferase [Bacteroidales bacterium]
MVKSLSDKKNRLAHGLFVVEGDKVVREMADSRYFIEEVFAMEPWIEKHAHIFHPSCPLTIVSDKDLERMSQLSAPNNALAVLKMPSQKPLEALEGKGIIIAVDGVQDPGNLGTIIRTADWFGCHQIICSLQCADVYNPKVLQATMGSFKRVDIFYTNLMAFLAELPNTYPVFAATLDGENMYRKKFPDDGLLLMGNESKGVGKELMAFVNQKLFIPSPVSNASERAESLNVSIATGVILAEWVRQMS